MRGGPRVDAAAPVEGDEEGCEAGGEEEHAEPVEVEELAEAGFAVDV